MTWSTLCIKNLGAGVNNRDFQIPDLTYCGFRCRLGTWTLTLTLSPRDYCGGTLISNRFVLTFANCVYNAVDKPWEVRSDLEIFIRLFKHFNISLFQLDVYLGKHDNVMGDLTLNAVKVSTCRVLRLSSTRPYLILFDLIGPKPDSFNLLQMKRHDFLDVI